MVNNMNKLSTVVNLAADQFNEMHITNRMSIHDIAIRLGVNTPLLITHVRDDLNLDIIKYRKTWADTLTLVEVSSFNTEEYLEKNLQETAVSRQHCILF
jgi:hypothetical protein